MFSKVDVNGPNAHPLFEMLKQQAPGLIGSEGIKWNFTKFLIDGKGEVVSRFGSITSPEKIEQHLVNLIS